MAKKSKNQPIKYTQPIATPKKEDVTNSSNSILFGLGAVLFTFLCFIGVKGHGFVNWDDDRNFYENPLITSINHENFWSNVSQIFKTPVIGNYNPLTIFSFALDQRMWGLDHPSMWHVENLVLHLISVLLIYILASKLGLKWPGALFTAILFGIHPMRVESVSWLTERKDVLFGVFFIAALLQYVRYKSNHSALTLFSIFLFFALSLLSKIQAVALPLSMMAVDYLLDQKFSIKNVLSKWPYLLMSLITGAIGIYFLSQQGSLDTNTNTFLPWQRIFLGSFSFIIYLIKWIIPFRMSPLYPYPPQMPVYFYPTILIAPIYLYLMYIAHIRNWKNLLFGLVFFLVNIVFLLQILGAGQGYLADRFTYIAYFGLFYILGYALDLSFNHPKVKSIAIGMAALMSIVFGVMTFQQNTIWKNSDTLWSHVLKYYTKTTLPWGNRANFLRSEGRINEALSDYNMAISLKEDPQTFNSRARLYFDIAKNSRDTLLLALKDYNKAIELKPGDGEFHVNRGATYARLGDLPKAMEDLNKGLELKPDHAVGYINRSVLYSSVSDWKNALTDLESYLKLSPYNSDIWYEKARLQRTLGNSKEALASYDRAIQINNSKGLYYYERARTHQILGNKPQAKADLNYAIQLGYSPIEPDLKAAIEN